MFSKVIKSYINPVNNKVELLAKELEALRLEQDKRFKEMEDRIEALTKELNKLN